MSLTPISKITVEIQSQPGWEGVRDWGLIVEAWLATVSPTIANHSQPRSISRDILTIATNSSSLAHQLTFGRTALCRQLNTRLTTPIKDLRFVAVGYTSRTVTVTPTDSSSLPIDSGPVVSCSRCDTRAREGELQRWGVCQFCAIDLGIIGGK
jgi:predicted nucleic acid-binding Zn ribbon protein